MSDVAKEVSWAVAVLLLALTLLSAPALTWAAQTGTESVAEVSHLAWYGMLTVSVMTYVLHLLRYNPIVRRRIERVATALGAGGESA